MNNQSTIRLESLYRRWSASGVGLLLSGNVQVDRMHLERLGNVVIEDEGGLAVLPEALGSVTEFIADCDECIDD